MKKNMNQYVMYFFAIIGMGLVSILGIYGGIQVVKALTYKAAPITTIVQTPCEDADIEYVYIPQRAAEFNGIKLPVGAINVTDGSIEVKYLSQIFPTMYFACGEYNPTGSLGKGKGNYSEGCLFSHFSYAGATHTANLLTSAQDSDSDGKIENWEKPDGDQIFHIWHKGQKLKTYGTFVDQRKKDSRGFTLRGAN